MVHILGPVAARGALLSLFDFKVPAGFPSPAADHIEKRISLDELLNVKAPHIYLVRIEGNSMVGAGIFDGDLVLVDRSIDPAHNQIVIAAINGEPLCKRLIRLGNEVILASENPHFPARYVLEGEELSIWGVVTYSVRSHDPKA